MDTSSSLAPASLTAGTAPGVRGWGDQAAMGLSELEAAAGPKLIQTRAVWGSGRSTY